MNHINLYSFSPYGEIFSNIFSVPIISPDGVMLKRLLEGWGIFAILITSPAAVESSIQLYNNRGLKKSGIKAQFKVYLLDEAYAITQM